MPTDLTQQQALSEAAGVHQMLLEAKLEALEMENHPFIKYRIQPMIDRIEKVVAYLSEGKEAAR